MTRTGMRMAVAFMVACLAAPAVAGVYTDDLSKCLVKASGSEGQATLVQWIFSSLALNPVVKPLSAVTDAQRDALNRKTADLYQRLLFADCRTETVAALKYEGAHALEAGFEVLGQVATRGLMTDPSTASGLAAYSTYLDKAKMVELFKEAGLTAQNPPAAASAQTPAQ